MVHMCATPHGHAAAFGLNVELLAYDTGEVVAFTSVEECIKAENSVQDFPFQERLHAAVFDGMANVLAVAHAGAVFGLDAKSLQVKWKIPLAGDEAVALEADDKGALYTVMGPSLCGGSIVKIDSRTGSLLWRKEDLITKRESTTGRQLNGRYMRRHHVDGIMAIGEKVVVLADGSLVCVDAAVGTLLWKHAGMPKKLKGLETLAACDHAAPEGQMRELTLDLLHEYESKSELSQAPNIGMIIFGFGFFIPLAIFGFINMGSVGRHKKFAAPTWKR